MPPIRIDPSVFLKRFISARAENAAKQPRIEFSADGDVPVPVTEHVIRWWRPGSGAMLTLDPDDTRGGAICVVGARPQGLGTTAIVHGPAVVDALIDAAYDPTMLYLTAMAAETTVAGVVYPIGTPVPTATATSIRIVDNFGLVGADVGGRLRISCLIMSSGGGAGVPAKAIYVRSQASAGTMNASYASMGPDVDASSNWDAAAATHTVAIFLGTSPISG